MTGVSESFLGSVWLGHDIHAKVCKSTIKLFNSSLGKKSLAYTRWVTITLRPHCDHQVYDYCLFCWCTVYSYNICCRSINYIMPSWTVCNTRTYVIYAHIKAPSQAPYTCVSHQQNNCFFFNWSCIQALIFLYRQIFEFGTGYALDHEINS